MPNPPSLATPQDGLTQDDLRQIRRLYIQAGRKVDSLTAGEYRSAFKGSGMEFEEVRPYSPGDDVRRIDWNVTARSDDTYVKEFREERELTLLLVLDISGSVRFGSGGKDQRTDKRLQIARVAGGLAYAAIRSNDRIGLVRYTHQIEQYLPPRKNRGHGWEIVRSVFAGSAQGRHTELAEALDFVNRVQKRRAVVVILSDFLGDTTGESLVRQQRALTNLTQRHRVHAFLFHDPLEDQIPGIHLLNLEDCETGEALLIDASALFSTNPLTERTSRLKKAGVRTTLVSTQDDAFIKLHQHFRGGR